MVDSTIQEGSPGSRRVPTAPRTCFCCTGGSSTIAHLLQRRTVHLPVGDQTFGGGAISGHQQSANFHREVPLEPAALASKDNQACGGSPPPPLSSLHRLKLIAKLCNSIFQRQIALYSPCCRRLSSSRFVTINSTSIKPSIKVRNLTYYIFGESL